MNLWTHAGNDNQLKGRTAYTIREYPLKLHNWNGEIFTQFCKEKIIYLILFEFFNIFVPNHTLYPLENSKKFKSGPSKSCNDSSSEFNRNDHNNVADCSYNDYHCFTSVGNFSNTIDCCNSKHRYNISYTNETCDRETCCQSWSRTIRFGRNDFQTKRSRWHCSAC